MDAKTCMHFFLPYICIFNISSVAHTPMKEPWNLLPSLCVWIGTVYGILNKNLKNLKKNHLSVKIHHFRFLRSVAYRWTTQWLCGYLGWGNTRPLPGCVYHTIRVSISHIRQQDMLLLWTESDHYKKQLIYSQIWVYIQFMRHHIHVLHIPFF